MLPVGLQEPRLILLTLLYLCTLSQFTLPPRNPDPPMLWSHRLMLPSKNSLSSGHTKMIIVCVLAFLACTAVPKLFFPFITLLRFSRGAACGCGALVPTSGLYSQIRWVNLPIGSCTPWPSRCWRHSYHLQRMSAKETTGCWVQRPTCHSCRETVSMDSNCS